MYRFKGSKYKNSTAKIPKKEECISDLSVESLLCYGNHIKAGAQFIACNIGTAGSGKVGIFKAGEKGRRGVAPFLSAHGNIVTDLEFSPFFHDTLLTSSYDLTVKIWHIPEDGLQSGDDISFTENLHCGKQPEVLSHHPLANVIAIACQNHTQLWDINAGSQIFETHISDGDLQSISWSLDGVNIASTDKAKNLKIQDVRMQKIVLESNNAHSSHRDSRVIYLGSSGKLLTTGYSSSRNREVKIWDARNIKSCLQALAFSASSGVLMPFYDLDTNLVFISGKGDSNFDILELGDTGEIKQLSQHYLPNQTKGMALSSKLCLDVMSCEVDRLIQLSSNQLTPIKIEVPRKSHRDFQADLFPDTFSDEVVLSVEEWTGGENGIRKKTTLDPNRRKQINSSSKNTNSAKQIEPKKGEPKAELEPKTKPQIKPAVNEKPKDENNVELRKPAKPFMGVRQCIFRHWIGNPLHPSSFITNLPPLSIALPPSCEAMALNPERVAIPLSTTGGLVAVLELSKTGRLAGEFLSLQNVHSVCDLKWNPFNPRQLAVGLDSGSVKVWNISNDDLTGVLTDADAILSGHHSKITAILFHPLASNILATCGFDSQVIVWNLETRKIVYKLAHDDEILDMAWSADGKYLATFSKGGKIFIFDPRNSLSPIKEGVTQANCKNARIVWVRSDKYIFVSGLERHGSRCVCLFDCERLSSSETIQVDSDPTLLVPYYDEDSNVVILTGKGDRTLVSFEVIPEPPFLMALSALKLDSAHQSFAYLPKQMCDVRKVEFARAWRLTKTTLEPFSFTVPRVKTQYFQDDIFPDTKHMGEPTVSAGDWLSGEDKLPGFVSLKPADMKKLSDAPKEAPKQKKFESYDAGTYKTDAEKREELLSAMSNKLDLDKKLEQDEMEGVDDDEWSD